MLILLGLLVGVAGDLPVHCTYKQIEGNWVFTLNSETFKPSLQDSQTYCGHGQPDQVLNIKPSKVFSFEKPLEEEVTLSEPNTATSSTYGKGTWTMVYDEGFLVSFAGIEFFTYSLYVKKGKNYASVCDRTTLGWYKQTDSKWGCFFAEKKEKTESYSVQPELTVKWVEPSYMSFLQKTQLYDDYKEAVEQINSSQSSWKADLSPQFLGLTVSEVSSRFGSKKPKPPAPFSSFIESKTSLTPSELSKLSLKDQESLLYFWEKKLEDIPSSSLPQSWDWSDIDGTNYVSEPRQQGNCGSCYTVTAVSMLEARLRIYTNFEFDHLLSMQYLIDCSFYTEGCDGGYPTLLNKFISEFGIVSEECMPYLAKNNQCKFSCQDGVKVSVKDYGYVGGYYGASNEENIMKELRARGPVIANFEPSWDFTLFKSGIYQSFSRRETSTELNDLDMREAELDWERVSHSVLLVGWGEENGQKYWKAINSWGTKWGENGYFKIKRGTDECSIESMAEAAVPYVVSYN